MDTKEDFIQERLESLHEIDKNIVNLLDSIGTLFDTYIDPSRQTTVDMSKTKEKFTMESKQVYGILSSLAIDLRKEVKIMDDNIGVYDKNDDQVMILPITVDQKNTTLGKRKLNEELKKLEDIRSNPTP